MACVSDRRSAPAQNIHCGTFLLVPCTSFGWPYGRTRTKESWERCQKLCGRPLPVSSFFFLQFTVWRHVSLLILFVSCAEQEDSFIHRQHDTTSLLSSLPVIQTNTTNNNSNKSQLLHTMTCHDHHIFHDLNQDVPSSFPQPQGTALTTGKRYRWVT